MSDKWLLASSRIATVFSAGAAGKDINDADATASNAVQNNYLNHKEQFKRSQAKKACATGDMSACAKVEELNTLDETRDQILDEIRAECASEGPAGCSFNMMTEIADELTSVLNGYEENEGSFGSGSIREISSLENYLRSFKNDPYGEALQPGILAPEDLIPGKLLLKLRPSGTKILLRMLRKPSTINKNGSISIRGKTYRPSKLKEDKGGAKVYRNVSEKDQKKFVDDIVKGAEEITPPDAARQGTRVFIKKNGEKIRVRTISKSNNGNLNVDVTPPRKPGQPKPKADEYKFK